MRLKVQEFFHLTGCFSTKTLKNRAQGLARAAQARNCIDFAVGYTVIHSQFLFDPFLRLFFASLHNKDNENCAKNPRGDGDNQVTLFDDRDHNIEEHVLTDSQDKTGYQCQPTRLGCFQAKHA